MNNYKKSTRKLLVKIQRVMTKYRFTIFASLIHNVTVKLNLTNVKNVKGRRGALIDVYIKFVHTVNTV